MALERRSLPEGIAIGKHFSFTCDFKAWLLRIWSLLEFVNHCFQCCGGFLLHQCITSVLYDFTLCQHEFLFVCVVLVVCILIMQTPGDTLNALCDFDATF